MYKYWRFKEEEEEKKKELLGLICDEATRCVLVFIGVISNPLMYLFYGLFFSFFVLFWDRE